MEVEPTDQRDFTTTGSGRNRNGNEAVACAASAAFARWLHYRYARSLGHIAWHIVFSSFLYACGCGVVMKLNLSGDVLRRRVRRRVADAVC